MIISLDHTTDGLLAAMVLYAAKFQHEHINYTATTDRLSSHTSLIGYWLYVWLYVFILLICNMAKMQLKTLHGTINLQLLYLICWHFHCHKAKGEGLEYFNHAKRSYLCKQNTLSSVYVIIPGHGTITEVSYLHSMFYTVKLMFR